MSQNISFDVIARDRASSTFSRIANATEKTEARLKRFGRNTAAVAGFTTLTTAATGFVKVGAQYTGSLNKIQALTGATDKQLDRMAGTLEGQSSNFAKMGQTTGDAASGMVELIKAGMGASQAMRAVAATMVLAKAGELSVAESASLVSNTLNVFHLRASKAAMVANVLANAANVSSSDVSDLRQALAMAGNVAAGSGASLQQTAAMLAELSNAGMQGSDAGTSLKTMLLSLQAPSSAAAKGLKELGIQVFGTTGKMRPIGDVLADTTKKLAGLTDKDRAKKLRQIFGTDAFRAARVIFGNGSKALEDLTKKVDQAGAAQRLAEAQSKGFTGTLKQLRAETISTAQAGYRQLQPSLDAQAKKLAKFVEQMRTGKGAGGQFVGMLKDAVAVGKGVLAFFNSIPGPVKKYGLELLVAGVALRKLTGLTSGFASGLASPIARTKQFAAEMTYTETRLAAVGSASRKLGAGLMQAAGTGGMLLLANSAGKAGTKMGALEGAAGGALSGAALGAFAGPQGAAIGAGIGALSGAAFALFRHTKSASDAARDALGNYRTYADTLNAVSGATTAATRAMVRQKLEQAGVLDASRAAGLADRQVVNAVVRGGKARENVVAALKREKSALDQSVSAKKAELTANLKLSQDFSRQSQARHDSFEAAMQSKKELTVLEKLRDERGKQIAATLKGIGAVDKSVAATRKIIAATTDYGKKLNALPEKKRIKVEATGIVPTVQGIAAVAKKIRATPAQVRTLILASGVNTTVADVEKVLAKMRAADKARANPQIHLGFGDAFARLAELARKMAALRGNRGSGGGGRGGGASNRTSGGFADMSPRTAQRQGELFGRSLAAGILKGLINKKMAVSKAIDRISDLMSKVSDKLANLRETRQGFLSTFSSDSIFGADLSTTGSSIGALLQFQQDQASKAAQLAADVQKVTSMGLSKSLIAQLQAQGSAGAEQLHLLAGGSADQIAQFNALNAQTQASLQAAGMTLGNAGRGGSINADIAVAQRQEKLLAHILAELRHVKDEETIVKIDGEGVIKIIKRRMHNKGVKSSDQLLRALT